MSGKRNWDRLHRETRQQRNLRPHFREWPATPQQTAYLQALSEQAGIPYKPPGSIAQATRQITSLLNRTTGRQADQPNR